MKVIGHRRPDEFVGYLELVEVLWPGRPDEHPARGGPSKLQFAMAHQVGRLNKLGWVRGDGRPAMRYRPDGGLHLTRKGYALVVKE